MEAAGGGGPENHQNAEAGMAHQKKGVNKYALISALLASVNSILLGYDISVVSGAILFIKEDLDKFLQRIHGIVNLGFLIKAFSSILKQWWKESQILLADKVGGVLNEVSSNDDNADLEILLHLKKKEVSVDSDCGKGGVSVREHALVPEGMWLRALKWHNDSKAAVKDFGNSFVADEQDVLP